ncbi:protein mono-ADP-ribosyltransferase PARP12-like [Engraulis encrasicolus]|uniref:protein mono-ADP-ribosyltransferase PARP12-like n=1 Tax=Engraulis encrasicolus TaxID=184585 RepID=UPI002FD35B6C
MASNAEAPPVDHHSDDSSDGSGQSSSSFDDSDDQSDSDTNSQHGASGGPRSQSVLPCVFFQSEPCKYYNAGDCRNGKKCRYLHVCKDSLKGTCRYGHSCRLRHIVDSDSDDGGQRQHQGHGGGGGRNASGGGRRKRSGSGSRSRSEGEERRSRSRRPRSSDSESDDDVVQGPYQWQLKKGSHGWKNIDNDHILEAQYSRSCTKGIKIYNTPHGAISIDFKHMRVLKKTNLKVRRRDTQQTQWLWYHRGHKRWTQFGEKDSKGNVGLKSSDVEAKYQNNKKGSFQFNVGSGNFEINFKDMTQENLSSGTKRKIKRRPLYNSSQGHRQITSGMRNMNLSSPRQVQPRQGPRQWQFSGRGGQWYDFKHRSGTDTECSVSSKEIEDQYQQDPQGTMTFTVSGQTYEIDFSAMTQTNLNTTISRRIRRV